MKIPKDKKKRSLHLKLEKQSIILKSIAQNCSISKSTRWNSELNLTMLLLNSHKTRLVKRCILTERKNKVDKSLNISRLSFLRLARKGFIIGLKKLGN